MPIGTGGSQPQGGAPAGPAPSFTPPITPGITGAPGPDKYLQSNSVGVVNWAVKPFAAGPGLDYVYDPSAVTTLHPVYKTVSELMTAVTAGPKGSRVLFTSSVTLPGGAWVLPQGTTFGAQTEATGTVTVTVPNGASLVNWRGTSSDGVLVDFQNSAPCLSFPLDTAGGGPAILEIVGLGSAVQRSGTSALYQVPDGETCALVLGNSPTQQVPAPTAPLFEGLGAGAFIILDQSLVGVLGGFQPGDVTGNGTLLLQNGPSATPLDASSFPGFSGTIQQLYSADPRNFGPQNGGVTVGTSPVGGLPSWQPAGDLIPAGLAGAPLSIGGVVKRGDWLTVKSGRFVKAIKGDRAICEASADAIAGDLIAAATLSFVIP